MFVEISNELKLIALLQIYRCECGFLATVNVFLALIINSAVRFALN